MSHQHETLEPGAGAYAHGRPPASVRERTFLFVARYSGISRYLRQIELELPPLQRHDEVMAGLAEALSNAVLHGALGISSRDRDAGQIEAFLADIDRAERRFGALRHVSVILRLRGSTLEIVVGDDGAGFDWTAPCATDHGISILHRVFDAVRWSPRGNIVHLTIQGVDP